MFRSGPSSPGRLDPLRGVLLLESATGWSSVGPSGRMAGSPRVSDPSGRQPDCPSDTPESVIRVPPGAPYAMTTAGPQGPRQDIQATIQRRPLCPIWARPVGHPSVQQRPSDAGRSLRVSADGSPRAERLCYARGSRAAAGKGQ